VKRGSEWARVTARDNAATGASLRWNTSNGQGFIREGRRGDIYAGRDGNVYRNTGDGWQRFDGGWQDVQRPEPRNLLRRGEGREGLSPEARERFQDRGGGEALRDIAGAGAAGAAGAALGQRLSGGEQVRRDVANRDAVRERAQQRQTPQQRPSTPERQAPQQREAAQRRAAQDRPAVQQRPVSQQRQAARPRPAQPQRPAARPQLPPNVMRDVQVRHIGNQRQMASRQFSRPPAQFSRSASFGPSRSMGPRGGFGGGGFGGRGGGGFRGGGRR
jgi:hypothetical protein